MLIICNCLQVFYEKSRLHYLLPIIVLVLYTLLGGYIFYSIEAPAEQRLIAQKKIYIEQEAHTIVVEIERIQKRARHIYAQNVDLAARLRALRSFRPFALNRLDKVSGF